LTVVTSVLVASIGIPTATILLAFTIRRVLFTFAIVGRPDTTRQRSVEHTEMQAVLVLVSCRNEEAMIPGLVEALGRLQYPPDRLQVVLVDDASTDSTAKVMHEQVAGRPGWHVLSLATGAGKAAALNTALASVPFGDHLYVLDADHRPDPMALVRSQSYLEDPQVAAVQGFTRVTNPVRSPAAFYSTVESYVNQLVTMRAKDRLGLAPALLGSNCVYRRDILAMCGGFRPGALSEDSDLTVAFHISGHVTRFAEDVVSHQQVPETVKGYLRQHVRWGRGLNDVARTHVTHVLRSPGLRLPLRIELILFASGYLDRLALVGAGVVIVVSLMGGAPIGVWLALLALSLATPLVQILALFIKERMDLAMWVRIPWIPLFLLLDVVAALRSIAQTLLDAPREWTKTERAADTAG
jgi:1,2-diacylglycerol 3-beta-glucosyltransferase